MAALLTEPDVEQARIRRQPLDGRQRLRGAARLGHDGVVADLQELARHLAKHRLVVDDHGGRAMPSCVAMVVVRPRNFDTAVARIVDRVRAVTRFGRCRAPDACIWSLRLRGGTA